MLMDQIIQAKQGSQADMLSLLQQFQPILKKYGRKCGEKMDWRI